MPVMECGGLEMACDQNVWGLSFSTRQESLCYTFLFLFCLLFLSFSFSLHLQLSKVSFVQLCAFPTKRFESGRRVFMHFCYPFPFFFLLSFSIASSSDQFFLLCCPDDWASFELPQQKPSYSIIVLICFGGRFTPTLCPVSQRPSLCLSRNQPGSQGWGLGEEGRAVKRQDV